MDIELSELCRNEKPDDRKRIELIRQASPVVLEECIGLPDCRDWFLGEAFRYRHDTDLERTGRIVGHANCPMELIALMDAIRPEMVADVPAMRGVQLAMMEPKGEREWQRLKRMTSDLSVYSLVEDYLYWEDKSFKLRNSNGEKADYLRIREELLCQTPGFVIEHCLKLTENHEYIASYMSFEGLEHYIERLSPKNAAHALRREGIPPAWFERFASHKSVVLRKAIAMNPNPPEAVLRKLAADRHAGIKEIALGKLPEAVRNSMLKESLSTSERVSTAGADDGRFLTVLRLPQADSAQLAIVASEADDLLACAASVHPQADKPVLDALRQRAGLPQWARIGLAMKTDRADEIDTLIHDGDRHLRLGLSSNPHLSLDQAMVLMRKLPDDRVLANLANTFINESDAVIALSRLATTKSPLATRLRSLLKDTIDEKKLTSLHDSHKYKSLVLHRLIARHLNCPKKLYKRYAWYLPDDLVCNPAYSLAVLESVRPIKPKPFVDVMIDYHLDTGNAPEYLCLHLLQSSDTGRKRKVITCQHANPNASRHLVVLDDAHTHRRFVHERAVTYSEYEYRMLARIGSPSVRKSVIEKGYASNAMLQELAQDKDKAVAMAAQKLAQKRNVPLAAANRVDKSSSRGLGNKAARLDLARASQDPEILSMLAVDKLADVRAAVAAREDLAPAVFLDLLKDPEERVLTEALSSIRRRVFTDAEKPILQERLLTVVADSDKSAQIRTRAIRHLPDPAARDAWYGREDGFFDSEIFAITADTGIIDDLLFRLQRDGMVRHCDRVFDNPNLTLEQCQALLAPHGRKIGCWLEDMVRKHPDLDVVVALLENNRELAEEVNFSRRDQDCSPDQVRALISNPDISLRTLISVWRDQLWKLPEPEFKALFERALERGMADDLAIDRNKAGEV